MSMVSLPSLQEMIEGISRERNLPRSAVEQALREALIKGYERYRRTRRMDSAQFDEDYFENFAIELDPEEEGFRVLSSKLMPSSTRSSYIRCNAPIIIRLCCEVL